MQQCKKKEKSWYKFIVTFHLFFSFFIMNLLDIFDKDKHLVNTFILSYTHFAAAAAVVIIVLHKKNIL